MFTSLVHRITSVFRRERCPGCGRKVRHETYCDVCGYKLIQLARDKMLRNR